MSNQLLPIEFREALNLQKLGINPSFIKFKNVTVESDKYITVNEDGQSISIIDTATQNTTKLPVKVDSAIMNPISKVIGLRSGVNLQIYNLEMRSRMKVTQMAENVVYWKWLNSNTIAIVTDRSVFHWSMDGDAQPVKQFDRAPYDGQVQVINYRASDDMKWLILGGIAQDKVAGGIAGVLQLYSVERKASQPTMNAHAGCFAKVTLDGRQAPSTLFVFTNKTAQGTKLSVVEVGVERASAFKCVSDIAFQNEQDFAVAMLPDEKHGVVFILTKAGFLYLYEIQSGTCIFNKRVSQATMFASITHEPTGGVLTVDQNGRGIVFSVNEDTIVRYINEVVGNFQLGVRMAARHNLPGADNIFVQQFDRLIQSQDVAGAAKLASEAPRGVLRTPDTIQKFQSLPHAQGQPAPILQYFSLLLKKGRLNQVESIELIRPVLSAGTDAGRNHIENWIKQDKLEYSEDLGDALRQHDLKLALSVYLRAHCPEKAIGCFLQLGQFDKIIAYATQEKFTPDYAHLVGQLHRVNREQGKAFASMLVNHSGGALIDVNQTADVFMRGNDVESTVSFLLDVLKNRGDRPEDADLQTKLLEISLMGMPQVADSIMEGSEYKFTHYDKTKVAQLSERAGLFSRALEHYQDLEDIKRVLQMGISQQQLKPEFLLNYFGNLTPEDGLECLRDLMKFNQQQNIRLVVEVAKKYSDQLSNAALIELFEEFDSHTGLYYYLGSFVNFSEDSQVVFKYIQAATKLQQYKEVERVCRDNEHYDAIEVKEFLLEMRLKDPRPLIHCCDRNGFQEELTRYLYSNNMFPFIEAYVQKMNPAAAPKVVASLLDQNAPEEQIKSLISAVRPPQCPVQELVEEVEERHRLRMLLPWLEARMNEANQDPALHNALAKVYVEINNNPKQFLINNEFYDSKVVGLFCESRDPHLSFIAYKRAWGSCDAELVAITNKHGFYKDQARYLVERQDTELWATVLTDDNEHKRSLVDQVVATALPEARDPAEVSTTVKAFMAADLPNELIELLERIVLHGSTDKEFHNNKNLQNLLILTAIKADKQRVMDYLNRLDNYDGPDIAKIAISDQYELFEEAFFIYKKFELGTDAINVLLHNIDDMQRATEFADYWDKPEVWSLLARAQLDATPDALVKEAIESYLKADDAQHFEDVIAAANQAQLFDDLIKFLNMARTKVREQLVDSELINSYARTNRLSDLEEFISGSHVAKIEDCGDRCFEEGLYQAARVLYAHINNFAKLALALVHLELYQDAVDAARKANSIPTWKAVCYACVDAEKFRLAQMCGVNIIVFNDHMSDLVNHYETGGFFAQVIQLLEQGINLDRAHQGIYTTLGVLYAQYKEAKLMEHINLFWSRLNIPALLQACKDNRHWSEAVYLYTHYDQFDNAVDLMIEHHTRCWRNELFKETVVKCSNTEVFYRAFNFYLRAHPLLLNDLLIELSHKLDHSRVVNTIRQTGQLPIIAKYLQNVQRDNTSVVNEAVNQLAIDEEDHQALRESIDCYDQFDQTALAIQTEKHERVEFRRIAAHLYKINKRFDRSVELSKSDNLYADAMETTAESQSPELAENLLRFFVKNELRECFAACLYTCYSLITPDVVLELSWRFGLTEFCMPFMVQTFREFGTRISNLENNIQKKEDAQKNKDDAEHAAEQAAITAGVNLGAPGLGAPLQIGYGPPMQNGFGAPHPQPGFGGPPPQQQQPGYSGFFQ